MAAGKTESAGLESAPLGKRSSSRAAWCWGVSSGPGRLLAPALRPGTRGTALQLPRATVKATGSTHPPSPKPAFCRFSTFCFAGAGSRCRAASTAHMRWQSPLALLGLFRVDGCCDSFWRLLLYMLTVRPRLSVVLVFLHAASASTATTPSPSPTPAHPRDLVACDWLLRAAARLRPSRRTRPPTYPSNLPGHLLPAHV